jgi:hypothetical protein
MLPLNEMEPLLGRLMEFDALAKRAAGDSVDRSAKAVAGA